jgi:hypothetical protein
MRVDWSHAFENRCKRATDNGIRDDRMADRECALRFLAFTLTPYTEYKAPDLDKFLNDTMKNLNQTPDQQLKQLEERFLRAMNAAFSIFGAHAFRKRYKMSTARNPESAVTLQQVASERTFLCPDGTKRVFSWRLRLTPGA